MRILLDHCLPRRFRALLAGHEVQTTHEMNWNLLKNSELLAAAAEERFEAFITVDQNVEYQQNLLALPLSVIILVAPNNRFATLKSFGPFVMRALEQIDRRMLLRINEEGNIHVVVPPT